MARKGWLLPAEAINTKTQNHVLGFGETKNRFAMDFRFELSKN